MMPDMTTPNSSGSEAFQWLDAHLIESLDSPDEAFDWVFMLQADDWPLFERVWSQRPPLWREALAYVLIDGPVVQAQRILRQALADAEFSVARQAAISLCHQMLEYPDEAPLDRSLLPRLRELRNMPHAQDMGEVDAWFRNLV